MSATAVQAEADYLWLGGGTSGKMTPGSERRGLRKPAGEDPDATSGCRCFIPPLDFFSFRYRIGPPVCCAYAAA